MVVLVTGVSIYLAFPGYRVLTADKGAGFLGRNLVQLLLDHNHEVVVLDSLWTGSRSNFDGLRGNKKLRYIQYANPSPHHLQRSDLSGRM